MLRNRLIACCLLFSLLLNARKYEYNYTFFTNSSMCGDYFFTHTAAMGNSFIKNVNNKLPVSEIIYHTPQCFATAI